MEWWFHLPIVFWCLTIFTFGLIVGSFLNVVVARLPYEKSLIWPSSRCFACYTKIRAFDNVPILGYLRLRGKCRKCGTPYSARYLWVEIGTGVAFLALFLAEVVFNCHGIPGIKYDYLTSNVPPPQCWALFLYHAALLSGLIAAAAVDAEHRIIPTPITYTAMAVGVIGGALMPWPWPQAATVVSALPPEITMWNHPDYIGKIPTGVQPWPFWGPTFAFAPPGSWKLGLLNSVIGALVGSLVIRITKWLFETGFGREALGLGDADLLMMAGAFLGWQIPVLSLFVGAVAALVLKVLEVIFRPNNAPAVPNSTASTPVTPTADDQNPRELPFGPGLAIGVVVTWFAWPWLGPQLQSAFFDAFTLGLLGAVMGVGILAAALLLRRPVEVQQPVAAK
ncbi:peptidase a24 : Prepilin signal peptidase PulO-like peptidase OS=Singulisphaera acidiphila (strain ATCC BAA-1392 / DSM 18658 / VKM B-2454 / MOB10) GN=Sinac_2635 PE=4 SV=1: DiS_P_DiS: Peptidase_A24: Peptidase_A24 [Gemmata massiliana]|uniref:Peptidase A24A N-terminal domain-containing protein n=1 Tax=Gemmata massiliana TaxID=1210884 RepID=A0A6P2CZF8_9BACT|nr:A24 family peptidase [Gemmata massiliana]VTR93947.1 peptidase a24 : Prepilin signal peptidase PulO-like peptidase OS=Singulisphaera acidiphila (strain ATCC BAA-1392 / DSM 18658 / VKM B-2454 / MOB10) GN=Sinac_2635 PE=4 SV=1: DiS_P_DiS: Peptidase_A24: Peptidase_A24 [Gemmata massiliana]